jgi:hypothetical protein
VIAGAVGVQTVYFVAGPGAPTPAPSATDTPSVPTPSDAPVPDLEPTGSPTP